MPLDAQLLRSSFERVIELEPMITPRFYQILFTRYPAVRPLFGKNSGRAQEKMLQEALVAVVEHIEDASWLATTLSALGTKLLEYGVTPEMFACVGDALLATLAEVLGGDWNTSVRTAWQAAYGAISDLMLAGMRPTAAPPAPDSRAALG